MNFRERSRFLFRVWRYRAKIEAAEVRAVLKRVKPGETVIDIGGHKGAFTYWLSKAVGPAGRVLTFEPQPELAAYLRTASERFRLDNVEIIEAALSDRPGHAMLHRASPQASPGASLEVDPETAGDSFEVAVDTLDRVLTRRGIKRVHFIKCDAEGHELSVFRGAEQCLTRCHPDLLFECEQRHHRGRSIQAVFDYLLGLGYRGNFFCQRMLLPFLDDRSEDVIVPDGVYNYLFEYSAARMPAVAVRKRA